MKKKIERITPKKLLIILYNESYSEKEKNQLIKYELENEIEKQKEYYERNKVRILNYSKEYHKLNREYLLNYQKDYYKKKKELV